MSPSKDQKHIIICLSSRLYSIMMEEDEEAGFFHLYDVL